MLGSLDEAEDLVQETLLKAWKGFAAFEGRSSVRSWLYRVATNTCLDALQGRARRVLPHHLASPSDPSQPQPARNDLPWLQPFPAEPVAPRAAEPESAVVARETMELAFLAAIQHLPPRQRAAVILSDVLGWSAKETAEVLESTVASVNSALQRARATLREQLPPHRADWAPAAPPTEAERALLRRYMAAVEGADVNAMADLLADEVRTTMPPWPMWFEGRDRVLAALSVSWDPDSPWYAGEFRMVPTHANGQLAIAAYLRPPGTDVYRAFAIGVVAFVDGRITEIHSFHTPGLFKAFGLTDEFSGPVPSELP
jgi:RNA polymerase sigma-70 factor (ECF subfamily)